jgi:hypothetical protein
MGRLIPAGTGLDFYRRLQLSTEVAEEEEVPVALSEEEARALEFLRGGKEADSDEEPARAK